MTDLQTQLEELKPTIATLYAQMARSALRQLQNKFGPTLKGASASRVYVGTLQFLRPVLEKADPNAKGRHCEMRINPDRLDKEASKYADAAVAKWGGKIAEKVGPLDEVHIYRMTTGAFAISGKRAGRRVRLEQDVIVKMSCKGTLFNQFPARIWVDGKFHSAAAYKRLMGDR